MVLKVPVPHRTSFASENHPLIAREELSTLLVGIVYITIMMSGSYGVSGIDTCLSRCGVL